MNFNIFNNLIISGAIQGVIFALIVLFNKKYKTLPNFFFAQVVLYLSLSNLYYWFFDTKLSMAISYYKNLYIPWNMLVLPMYYYFVLSYLGEEKEYKRIRNYLFLPFLLNWSIHLFLLFHKLFFTSYFSVSVDFINYFYDIEEYVSLFFTVFVIYRTFVLIRAYEKKHQNYMIHKVKTDTKWLKNLLYFGVFTCLVWGFAINNLDLERRYVLWLSISFLVYWLGYLGIYYNGIFNQRKEIRELVTLEIKEKEKVETSQSFERIQETIIEEKLYLNPNFGLALLSEKLGQSESYISHTFNKNSILNFSSFVNELRVENAKELLKNEEYNKYTIISIGLEAGFNSKTAFYNAFKKATGVSPSQFRKENMS